tara:strand:- start:279 stop:416 length:138 start_codon:yes stop_codon:yes gene_type:complete
MSQAGSKTSSNKRIESFRNYNKPKKRMKIQKAKRKLPLKTTKGFG